jgi:hypothetical protein
MYYMYHTLYVLYVPISHIVFIVASCHILGLDTENLKDKE